MLVGPGVSPTFWAAGMARKRKRFHRQQRRERWALNCERVFTVLTSGPFPSGSPEDDLVDAHLSFCPECRRLAEALRPTESMLAGGGRTAGGGCGRDPLRQGQTTEKLPGYWPSQRRLSALDELKFAPAAHHSDAGGRFDWHWLIMLAFGATITIGVLVGLYQVGCLIDAVKRQ